MGALVDTSLTPNEARMLDYLRERERTTLEQIPLSLNALITGAGTRKSSRDRVLVLDEATVRRGGRTQVEA